MNTVLLKYLASTLEALQRITCPTSLTKGNKSFKPSSLCLLPPRICYSAHLAHPFLGFLGTQNLNFNSRVFRSPSLLLGVSLSCPAPNCATRGLICAIAQNHLKVFLHSWFGVKNLGFSSISLNSLMVHLLHHHAQSLATNVQVVLDVGSQAFSWLKLFWHDKDTNFYPFLWSTTKSTG